MVLSPLSSLAPPHTSNASTKRTKVPTSLPSARPVTPDAPSLLSLTDVHFLKQHGDTDQLIPGSITRTPAESGRHRATTSMVVNPERETPASMKMMRSDIEADQILHAKAVDDLGRLLLTLVVVVIVVVVAVAAGAAAETRIGGIG